jgi:uncharacterized membrane protein (UPF0127 family)
VKRASALSALVLCLCLYGTSASASGPLPSSARVLSSIRLHGFKAAYAVTYRTGATNLGVVQRGRLLWHLALPSKPTTVFAPKKTGLFGAIVPGKAGSTLYGFRLQHGKVISGITGVAGGAVSGDAGARRDGAGAAVLNRDSEHQGSVKYRIASHYGLCEHLFCLTGTTREPDYASPATYPKPNAVVTTKHGDTVLIRLEVASTEEQRAQGLMNRASLDADSGMIFVWPGMSTEGFWMENTLIPLTVAFIDTDGTILDMEDMEPMTENVHYSTQPYHYALEVNQGFFQRNGIDVGDRLKVTLGS